MVNYANEVQKLITKGTELFQQLEGLAEHCSKREGDKREALVEGADALKRAVSLAEDALAYIEDASCY